MTVGSMSSCFLDSMSEDEIEAWKHAAERVEQDGAHSVVGCPRFCRAICRYRRVIEAMQARGIEVPS